MQNIVKILIADDSPTLLNLVKFLLLQERYEVITAVDGIEALEKIYQVNPDLIILDIIMPKMTGYQVCRILKSDKETRNIPIILLTAQEGQKDKFWGLKTGADKYITKSFELDQTLIPEVKILLEKFKDTYHHQELTRQKMDNSEIISLVNGLLDKQLFESTIINEVNNLSITIQDYEYLTREILLLINKIVGYDIALFFLIDEKENDLWIRTNIEINDEIIKIFQSKILEEIKDKITNIDPSSIKIHLISIKDENFKPNIKIKSINEFHSYFSKQIYLHNECVGLFSLLNLGNNEFNEEIINTCNIIINQSLIVIDNAKLYKRTQELAITDGLTRLYNHRYFQEQLDKEIKRTNRYGHNLSLIMIDIDHFKHFNDVYGHQAGDAVLKEVAALIKNNLRNIETLARYGGEEFIIILPETSLENAVSAAERIRTIIEGNKFSIKFNNPDERITISLGVSSFMHDSKEKSELISCADKYLYLAKKQGRNKVCSKIS